MLQSLDLNGTWRLRWSDGQRGRAEYAQREQTDQARYIDAQVPGEVHLDVWHAGWIQDPYVGTNVLAARWVEECIWSYRREFDAPPEAIAARRCWLSFEGLDLVASIVLNGQEVGRHHNAFYPCRIEITGKLRPGGNVLAVHLDAGLYDVCEKPAAGYQHVSSFDQRLHKRHWLRKPQSQFSWDWSQRLINVGIHKPVRLEWSDDPVRIDQLVPLAELSPDLKRGSVRTRLFVEGLEPHPCRAQLTVEIPEAGRTSSADVEIRPGLHPVETTITLNNPQLWWPVGHGEQHRYTLRATLRIDGQTIGQREARIGFRHVRVNQDPHPQSGRYFNIEVNGRKILCKGGNFVPADMVFARIDRPRYEKLIDLALEANFNFLRIWGGGLYESDDFYDLCDERGILVWQEFIYACSRYPTTDEAFFNDARTEAIWNIRRLASHPSLIVWCGNNEIEQGDWQWNYAQGIVMPDHAFFHITLPRLLSEEDPTRYYQPSSPYSPPGMDPNRDDVGDQHPWSVGFHNSNFHDYRRMICRFPNEGGILGPTSLPTMLACLPEGQRFPASFAWQTHDNSVDSWAEPSVIDQMTQQWLGRDIRQMSIEEFVYYGGLLQAEGLREYIDNFRRRMFSTGSAVFWMFNDTWPAVRSWTIVDYYLRRTPAFWAVRRAMAPISVVVAQESEDQITIFGINDTAEPIPADLHYGLFPLAAGPFAFDRRTVVTLAPNASTPLASFPRSQRPDPRSSAAFAILSRAGVTLARNRLFLLPFKDLHWPKPQIHTELRNGQATFHSDTFAWGVCLDLDGEHSLPDNLFDLYPGIPHTIAWPDPHPPQVRHVGNLGVGSAPRTNR